MNGVTQFAFSYISEPAMLLSQNKGATAFADSARIALENCLTSSLAGDGEAVILNCQDCAYRQANQVVGIRQGVGFVEVVYSPDESALLVTPSSEIFHVEITNGENLWRLSKLRTNLRPQLRPAIKSRTQKHEGRLGHALMFQAQISLDHPRMAAQPFLELLVGFNDIHGQKSTIEGTEREVKKRRHGDTAK